MENDTIQNSDSSSKYFMLECLAPAGVRKALIEFRDPDRDRLWIVGERLTNPPDTILDVVVRRRGDAVLMEMWKVPLPIMSLRLLEALRSAGVTNLETFPIRLVDTDRNETHEGYVAFNIVGCIAAADLAKSNYQAPDGPLVSVDFDTLAIDSSKTSGALLFRLAESVSGIVVHETVKQVIEQAGIDTLSFIEPANWAG